MFLDNMSDLFLLSMQGTATLTPPIIVVLMNQVLSAVRMSLLKYWNFSMYSSPLGCSLNCSRVSPPSGEDGACRS